MTLCGKFCRIIIQYLSATDLLWPIFHNADMQCGGCGKNNECHSYFTCIETGPDLERPNVRSLVQKCSWLNCYYHFVKHTYITSSISYLFYPKMLVVFAIMITQAKPFIIPLLLPSFLTGRFFVSPGRFQ